VTLHVRRARPEDQPAVLEICAHTWENGDYIPLVWEQWLADEAGPLFVGVLDDRVVALEKVTWTSPSEVWLEGMRVHPDYRRAGIATALFRYSLQWAAARGARIARLATSSENLAVHRMASAASFRLVLRQRFYQADAASGDKPSVVSGAEAGGLWQRVQRWQGLRKSQGLYHWDWAWQRLTRERFLGHVEQGEVWSWKKGPSVGMAILKRVQEPETGILVGYWDGTPTALPSLLRALRSLASDVTPPRVGLFAPEEPSWERLLQEAGYGPGWWEETLWIFEGALQPLEATPSPTHFPA